MTVTSTMAGLLPILWAIGNGRRGDEPNRRAHGRRTRCRPAVLAHCWSFPSVFALGSQAGVYPILAKNGAPDDASPRNLSLGTPIVWPAHAARVPTGTVVARYVGSSIP